MTTTDSLTRAIEYLGATDLGGGRYAYQPLPDSITIAAGIPKDPYFIVTADALRKLDLLDLSERYDDEGNLIDPDDAWVDETEAVQMPTWWTPTQQFAVRHGREITATGWGVSILRDHIRVCGKRGDRIVTADITTGEEIPA